MCVCTQNVFTYRGFVHHHPNSSVMYHHRAGTTGGKYDPNSPQGRSVTHLMLQPSCAVRAWVGGWHMLGHSSSPPAPPPPLVAAQWKLKWYFAYQIDRTGNPTTTPKDCKYSLLDMVGLQKACGLAYTSQEGPSVEPPVVEVRRARNVGERAALGWLGWAGKHSHTPPLCRLPRSCPTTCRSPPPSRPRTRRLL